MSIGDTKLRRIVRLAEAIVADIRGKNLQPGDRYLGTIDTARMLRVDTSDVNRAMQLLVKRRVLTRRQRLGTFVGDGIGASHIVPLSAVRFLIAEQEIRSEGLFDSDVMMGFQEQLPHVKLGIHSVPRTNEAEEMQRLVAEVLRNAEPEGLVLVGATLGMQRAVAASGVPAVVFGHPYPSVKGLSFVDRDQRQIGRTLAQYLLKQGCRRIVCMFRRRMLPGDHLLLDAVGATLMEAGLAGPSLTVRCLPHDAEVIRAEVNGILDASDGPIGLLARVSLMAEIVAETVAARDNRTRYQATVVSGGDYYSRESRGTSFPFIRSKTSLREEGSVLARVLLQQFEEGASDSFSELLEIQLANANEIDTERE